MKKVYAGIGSRRTPDAVLEKMVLIGCELARLGWLCSTGGADGADTAFEQGAQKGGGKQALELWLPWQGFNGRQKGYLPAPEAYEIAAKHHSAWPYLKRGVRALLARDAHQVLGADLQSPVKMIICWTPDGSLDGTDKKSGGTGMALRIAREYPQINIFNLQNEEHMARIDKWLGLPSTVSTPEHNGIPSLF